MTEKTDKPAPAWKGLNTDSMPVFIGYDQAERMVAALLDRAAAWHPDSVVGIARGGLVPATMASCMLALPLAIAGWDRAEGIMRWIGPAAQGPRVLLVDDCSATGTTLRAARDWLLAQDFQVMTLTIVHDPETTALVPDLSHPMRALFRLPWERGEATPTASEGLVPISCLKQPPGGLRATNLKELDLGKSVLDVILKISVQ